MFRFCADDFRAMTGSGPVGDDLDRLNCEKAGLPGHRYCGFCDGHKVPRFVCGCKSEAREANPHDKGEPK